MNGATFSNHLANLRYSVCVRRESGYCSIEWGVGTSVEVRLSEQRYQTTGCPEKTSFTLEANYSVFIQQLLLRKVESKLIFGIKYD